MSAFPFHNQGALIGPGRDRAAVALIDLSGPAARSITYGALDAMANAVARGLLKRGLRRGDRIGILAANSTEFLAALYGAQRAGLVAVPVNWRFPAATVDYVLGNSGAALAFCDEARRAAVPAGIPAMVMGGAEWDALMRTRLASLRGRTGWISTQLLQPSGAENKRVLIATWHTRADWEAYCRDSGIEARDWPGALETAPREEWCHEVLLDARASEVDPLRGAVDLARDKVASALMATADWLRTTGRR